MFGFDRQYAMFDITPVENQFVLEYMPDAKGDYLKVYLYGLLYCYHPDETMSINRMSLELNMSEEDVLAAFRYWERRGLVRRISDDPPRWQYINIKQKNLSGTAEVDPEYEEFSNAVYEAFDKVRRLHGSELNTCFEWKEDLKLPTEVIIMLLNHMVEVKGRNFRIADAEKAAIRMAEENIRTVDAAEEFFLRDGKDYTGVRNILKKLGKRYLPSEAQVSLYRKWTKEWNISPEAIEEAVELTAKGDPSLGYLDGILNSMRQENSANQALGAEQVRKSSQRTSQFREVLSALGRGEVTAKNLELYDRMRTLYPQDVILTAARECGHSGKRPEDVLKLLESWKEKGLETDGQVNEYIRAFHSQTELIRELKRIWGQDDSRVGKTDRSLILKWENELGFNQEMILAAAPSAASARAPMPYLDRILTEYREKGITTPEAVENERKKGYTPGGAAGKPAVKTVLAQQYEQRDYTGVDEQILERQTREFEERLRRMNGGQMDA